MRLSLQHKTGDSGERRLAAQLPEDGPEGAEDHERQEARIFQACVTDAVWAARIS